VDRINNAESPIYEEGLSDLLQSVVRDGKLSATTDLAKAVAESDLSLIAVGTPYDGHHIDLSYIREAAEQIGMAIKDKRSYHMVVVKSTVVPGTTQEVVLPIIEEHSGKMAGKDFGVGMNPEFLREGEAVKDFMEPDRIVLGGVDERSCNKLAELYESFDNVEKIACSPRTAEMIKYTANSLLATLISFSNEIGNLCKAVGDVDVTEVMAGVHLDKRFSPVMPDGSRIFPSSLTYLAAGCGFGGSCFPKDVKALIQYGQDRDQPMQLLKAVVDLNADQPNRMVEMLLANLDSVAGKKIAMLGMAFKPGTDDVRESPSLTVAQKIIELGCEIVAFDPVAQHEASKSLAAVGVSLEYAESVEACLADADAILIMTSWPQFANLPELIEHRDVPPLVIDGRRMLDKDSVQRYAGIGL
jgi:UDPglucose 6-dehydrogenase/GDP-mannose 6-dehydrogenase